MRARHRWPGAQAKPHERIRSFLVANGEAAVTAATVAALTGTSTSQARYQLEALVRRGKAVRDGDRYRAAPTGQEGGGVEHV
ncbi:hypothetical protein [Streptomyces aquilus]